MVYCKWRNVIFHQLYRWCTGGVQVSDAPYTAQIYLRKKAKGDNSKYFACVLCISDTVDEDDDLYDFVEDEENEGDEIYEDLMRTDEPPETVSGSHMTCNLQQKGGCSLHLQPANFAGLPTKYFCTKIWVSLCFLSPHVRL